MGSKDDAYSALEVYRMCFACGRAEPAEVEDRGGATPQQEVKTCPDCGSRMYALQGVEAYFDRFFGDSAFSDADLETMEVLDVENAPEGSGYGEGDHHWNLEKLNMVATDYGSEEDFDDAFVVGVMGEAHAFRPKTRGFRGRFERCLEVSKRHALKMLRNEAELLTGEWPSSVMGCFRTRGELADTALESMFVRGRFTLEDARHFEESFGADDDGPYVERAGEKARLAVKEGYAEWLGTALDAAGDDKGRRAACIASACTMGLESTVAADVDPGYVVRDDEIEDVTNMMATKVKAAFGDACSMEITDDGRLVISAESRSTDDLVRALAAAGIARPLAASDGVVLADARAHASKALQEALKQPSQTKLEPELRKGLRDVLGDLSKAAAKRDSGRFATIDDLKTIKYADAVALVKELCDRGYVESVIEDWSYAVTASGRRALKNVSERSDDEIGYDEFIKRSGMDAQPAGFKQFVADEVGEGWTDTLRGWNELLALFRKVQAEGTVEEQQEIFDLGALKVDVVRQVATDGSVKAVWVSVWTPSDGMHIASDEVDDFVAELDNLLAKYGY